MFERFIKNKMCVDIMMWLLNHSTGDYDAAIIAHDIGAYDIAMFTTAIYILDQLDIVNIDDNPNEVNLRIIFNEDSIIVQSFRTLKDCFDNEAYRNSNACSVLSDFVSSYDNYEQTESSLINQIQSFSNEYLDEILNIMKNYKDFELPDDPLLAERQKAIIEEARELDKVGQLENFIEFVNMNRK